jgi:bacteriocin biosynthesis cyclodehydratase domain-containing protein
VSNFDRVPAASAIRFADVYGIYILGPDEVQFRTGSLSGTAYVVSDPKRRGLLGAIIEKLLSDESMQRRPWNEAEGEVLDELLPGLLDAGIVESDEQQDAASARSHLFASILRKDLVEARIAVLGHGVLGEAVVSLLTGMPCGSVTTIESTSVAAARPAAAERLLPRPRDSGEWVEAVGDHDWVVAAQDCFEPEELAALNRAALHHKVPWSLVCLDGHEGWVGPTFIPGQTGCFTCFRRRLFAGAAEPKYVFADPAVTVHRVPSPCSAGPETRAWVSLITSIFALELIAATRGCSFTFNHMLIVHRLDLTFEREAVLRLPRCPDCSPGRDDPPPNVFAHVLSTRRPR